MTELDHIKRTRFESVICHEMKLDDGWSRLRRSIVRMASSLAIVVLLNDRFVTITRAAEPDVRRDAVVRAVETVIQSVVNIGTEMLVEGSDQLDQVFRDFFGPYYRRRPPDAPKSLGSGVIIDDTGYILTNFHVVRRANRITVTLADGREREARLMSGTTRSDVALLKIIPKGNESFKAVRFAADDDLLLGETVIALGNPFGLGISVSRGILSSRSRRPPVENTPLDLQDWLQTDAAINPGNSGGPLVNLHGELIGLNVAIFREAQGIGFAIPIKRVSEAMSEIFTPEAVRSLWLGAKFQGNGANISIASVQQGSPAEKAGLRAGDRVLRVNERTPRNLVELNRELIASGQRQIELTTQRGNDRRDVSVQLVPEKEFFTPNLIRQKLGATVQVLDDVLAREFGLGQREALVITSVERGGPAEAADLKRGYIIQAIDGQIPGDLVQAAKVIYGKKRGSRAELSLIVPRPRGRLIELYQATTEVVLR